MFSKKSSPLSFLAIIIFLACFLRFYNLLWGNGFFFNPDERNIASSLAQLKWPNLHPHFFAYGQFSIYLAYFSYRLTHCSIVPLLNCPIAPLSFKDAVFWLRFYSALASTLTIPVVYLIAKQLLQGFVGKEGVEEDHFCKEDFMAKTSLSQGRRIYAPNFTRPKAIADWKKCVPKTPLLAALFTAFTPALIQAAHFGTTESLLTFFLMLIVYFSLLFLKTQGFKYLFYLGIATGVALGTKLSSIFFIAAPILAIVFVGKKRGGSVLRKMSRFFLFTICYLLSTFLFFLLSSPYNFLEFNDFLATTRYETGVAYGSAKVFYTRQFINTTPVGFQLKKIFPFALGWPLFILGTLGFLTLFFQFILQRRNQSNNRAIEQLPFKLGILVIAFLAYLLPNAFLFAKWTRFMTPILPFFAIFAACFLYKLQASRPPSWLTGWLAGTKLQTTVFAYGEKLLRKANSQNLRSKRGLNLRFRIWDLFGVWDLRIGILIILSILPGVAFFSVYARPDVRVQATNWIYQNIPSESYVLSETANVVDIPLGPYPQPDKFDRVVPCQTGCNLKVISFDFYHLDENPDLLEELVNHLHRANYLFIPSRRIFLNHMRLKNKYLLVNNYYRLLFNGGLGFEKIAEITSFPCPIPEIIIQKLQNLLTFYPPPFYQNQSDFCRLFSDEQAEETFTVFDHPVIRIYKKARGLTKKDYQRILTNGLDLETEQIVK